MKSEIKEKGLGYFPCDTNMFHNPEIQILLSKYGIIGYGLYNAIIQLGQGEHSKGYYYNANEDNLLLLSKDSKVEYDKLVEIIGFMCEKKLFDKGLYEKYNILTCRRMQKNYCTGSESRKNLFFIKEYLLINPLEYKPKKARYDILITYLNSEKSELLTEKPVQKGKKPVLLPLKERKGKEKKRKESSSLSADEKEILQSIVDRWNNLAIKNHLRIVTGLPAERIALLRVRLSEKSFDFDKIINEIKKSSYLLGTKPKSDFKVFFDWIIKNDLNYVKILEGNYRDEGVPDEKPPITMKQFADSLIYSIWCSQDKYPGWKEIEVHIVRRVTESEFKKKLKAADVIKFTKEYFKEQSKDITNENLKIIK